MAGIKMNALWWWIDRWRKSTAFTDMTLEQQGAYRNLLDEAQLRGGAIPNDERILAKASGDATSWKRLRPTVMSRFELQEDGWHNPTLDEVSAESKRRALKQANYRNKRGNGSGNSAGNAGGNGRGNGPPQTVGNGTGNAGVPPISVSVSERPSVSPPLPPTARGKRPIYAGNRLTVFEWQLEDLQKMLGKHADPFDLHQWFNDLDQRVMASGEVIPKRDGGRWLEQETLAEARRRGLPFAGESEDPYAHFPHAWTCGTCGEVHEGTKEQARHWMCLKEAS